MTPTTTRAAVARTPMVHEMSCPATVVPEVMVKKSAARNMVVRKLTMNVSMAQVDTGSLSVKKSTVVRSSPTTALQATMAAEKMRRITAEIRTTVAMKRRLRTAQEATVVGDRNKPTTPVGTASAKNTLLAMVVVAGKRAMMSLVALELLCKMSSLRVVGMVVVVMRSTAVVSRDLAGMSMDVATMRTRDMVSDVVDTGEMRMRARNMVVAMAARGTEHAPVPSRYHCYNAKCCQACMSAKIEQACEWGERALMTT
jgi:hypothetical protein